MNVNKEKVPKGISYILKSSWLEEELVTAEINTHIDLLFAKGHRFFEAFYWLPNKNINDDRFYIRTGVVESKIRQHPLKQK